MSTILSLKRTIFFALLSCGFAQMSNADFADRLLLGKGGIMKLTDLRLLL